MVKEVKKEVKRDQNKSKLNFYLCIVECIKNTQKLPDNFGSIQKLNYYLKPLKTRNIIFKLGYGVWGVDWDKFMIFYKQEELKNTSDQKVKKSQEDTLNIRGHGYHFNVYVPSRIDWSRRKSILAKSNKAYQLLKNSVLRSKFLGNKVWFTSDGISIYFNKNISFLSNSAKSAEEKAIYYLKRIVKRIETTIKQDLSYKGKLLFHINKAHYGKIEDALAKHCNKENKKIRCIHEGKEWFLIDNSWNLNESETTGSDSKDDMDNAVKPCFNSIKEYKDLTGEAPRFTDIAQSMSSMSNIIDGLVNHQKLYAENMVSHVKAIQELAKGVSELRHEIRSVNLASFNKDQRKLSEYR